MRRSALVGRLVWLCPVERFEGLCILATNRKVTLDAALERRVAIKVEFDRPDRAMRRAIWRKIVPEKLPLGRDVDMEALSDPELTGGEIKNVILNAARLALVRGPKGPIRKEDLEAALAMEGEGRWSGRASIGFGS